MTRTLITLLSALIFSTAALASPSLLILKNQFGEQSNNTNIGASLPLAGSANVILLNGTTAPVDATTGDNIAAKGSIYIARDTGAAYSNTGTITDPVWTAFAANNASGLLTGFSAGAGTVSGADTVLQGFNKLAGNTQNKTVLANVLTGFVAAAGVVANTDTVLEGTQKLAGSVADLKNGKFTPTSETVAATGAISTTTMVSLVNNATGGDYAITLAAPSSQDGQLKIIKFGTSTHAATLAMTNIQTSGVYTASGTTTLTFSITGQTAIFIAVGTKWVYLGGSAIAT